MDLQMSAVGRTGTSSEVEEKGLLEHFFFFPKRKPVIKEKGK